jgi:hypothetical protein
MELGIMAKRAAVLTPELAAAVQRMVREKVTAVSTPTERRMPSNVGASWLMRAEEDIAAGNYGAATPAFSTGDAQIALRNKTTGLLEPHEPNSTPVSGLVYNLTDRFIRDNEYFLASRTQDGTLIVLDVYARPGWAMIGVVAAGGITGRNPAFAYPGVGNMQPYLLNSIGQLQTVGTPIQVYNLSTAPIAAGQWVQAKREWYSGNWFLDFEAC